MDGVVLDTGVFANSTEANVTEFQMPHNMVYNQSHTIAIVAYSILMVVGATGNISVIALLVRRTAPKTRINNLLMHLAIADLLVVFLMMPFEIGWNVTVCWKGGNILCKIMAFCRTFGLYLSGFILMCISIDRYYAVLKPLQLRGGEKRGKYLLIASWVASFIASLPQAIIFHVETHPKVSWYTQCVEYNSLTPVQGAVYSFMNISLMYGAPLITIIFCYLSIILEIIKRSKEDTRDKMRRSSNTFLGKARIRTLKMTLTIVCVFVVCWTPYYIISLWYWLDKESADMLDYRVSKALFLFASLNSCMNPLVYGLYNVRARAQDSVHRVPTRKDLYTCEECIELQKYPMVIKKQANQLCELKKSFHFH